MKLSESKRNVINYVVLPFVLIGLMIIMSSTSLVAAANIGIGVVKEDELITCETIDKKGEYTTEDEQCYYEVGPEFVSCNWFPDEGNTIECCYCGCPKGPQKTICPVPETM